MGLPLGTDALRAGGGVIAFARHPGFLSQSRSKTPAPIRVDFYIGSTSPCAQSALFCLGAGSGIPPAAAPSFRGVKKEKLHEVSRIEPSGQDISPEPCTTHGFGVGGTGRIRTGDPLGCISPMALTTELLSHITAGYGSTPAGGLCLLSAEDRLGDSHFWQRWGICAPGGRGGIRTRG